MGQRTFCSFSPFATLEQTKMKKRTKSSSLPNHRQRRATGQEFRPKLNKVVKKKKQTKYWSGYVTKYSVVLNLEEGVFTWDNPRKIAKSLKKSAEASLQRKGTPFQSAMSMLNFYINRAGKNLPSKQKKIFEKAKIELRKVFNRK